MDYTTEEVNLLLQTGIELSMEKDKNQVLNKILNVSMVITNCDAGTLYVCKDGQLHFYLMKTISQDIDKDGSKGEIELPSVPMEAENVCAYTALRKRPMKIEDVYKCTELDFSGPRKYDKMTGYRTKSMMTVPLMNQESEVVGVLQLINAIAPKSGSIIPFSDKMEGIVLALASQAAIAMTNICFLEEINDQMWSFTEAMAETIDARTPYNANHIRIVANYSCLIADYINKMHEEGKEEESFPFYRREQLRLSALLHDIGKVAIPTSVMNKATRLEYRIDDIHLRFELFRTKYQVQMLNKHITPEQYSQEIKNLDYIEEIVKKINYSEYLSDEMSEKLEQVIDCRFSGEEGSEPLLTEEEKDCLRIKRGTLTAKEREIMESHVVLTERILEKVRFNHKYEKAKLWAAQHHERLNGCGYPRHLTAEQLPLESRILAVADVCDALIATDRPYRKPIPKEKAFAILRSMVKEGQLDGKLVDYLDAALTEREEQSKKKELEK